jgi:hypothetical protein
MADRNDPYRALAIRLKELRPRDFQDLLAPLASAAGEVRILGRLIEAAEESGAVADARRLKTESLIARGAFAHAAYRIVEAIGEDLGGSDLVAALLGDGGRLLADELLGDDD